ncbi:hypothetical protein CRM22_010416 [Opisthorchis felineus]|nr:hypothetical protein CRM22_010416 [Opisthorchis felineus]
MDGILLDLCQSTRQDLEELYNNSSYFKPSRLFLVVHVIEARELADKDVNGLSDPYCVLGIVLGHDELTTLSSQTSNSNDNIGSLLQLGTEPTGALTVRRSRDSIIRHMTTQDSVSSVCLADTDVLRKRLAFKGHRKPVKDVRQTSVKPQTLNPFWDERFQFELNDITTDQLELDIWDHDEETSIVDAVRSLNEVRGVKQLGRYFKQVSQTARKGQTGDVDDFLGSITVDLKKLPLEEVDQWIKLEGRSAKSKVQGEIHIRLKLTTVEDGSDEPKLGEIKDHIMLLYEVIISELKRNKKPSTEWSGELSAAAQWLISQHAFQNGLSELQLAICSWVCYSKVYRKMPINCSIVLARLQELTVMWSDKELGQEHLAFLTKSFEAFTEHALMLLTQCRVVFSQERPETLSHFENLLQNGR